MSGACARVLFVDPRALRAESWAKDTTVGITISEGDVAATFAAHRLDIQDLIDFFRVAISGLERLVGEGSARGCAMADVIQTLECGCTRQRNGLTVRRCDRHQGNLTVFAIDRLNETWQRLRPHLPADLSKEADGALRDVRAALLAAQLADLGDRMDMDSAVSAHEPERKPERKPVPSPAGFRRGGGVAGERVRRAANRVLATQPGLAMSATEMVLADLRRTWPDRDWSGHLQLETAVAQLDPDEAAAYLASLEAETPPPAVGHDRLCECPACRARAVADEDLRWRQGDRR